jgi:hypothetical protein
MTLVLVAAGVERASAARIHGLEAHIAELVGGPGTSELVPL